jgi:hypothetical protein
MGVGIDRQMEEGIDGQIYRWMNIEMDRSTDSQLGSQTDTIAYM